MCLVCRGLAVKVTVFWGLPVHITVILDDVFVTDRIEDIMCSKIQNSLDLSKRTDTQICWECNTARSEEGEVLCLG